jgi:hypothetical protein
MMFGVEKCGVPWVYLRIDGALLGAFTLTSTENLTPLVEAYVAKSTCQKVKQFPRDWRGVRPCANAQLEADALLRKS